MKVNGLALVQDLFADAETVSVPSTADRYGYKKAGGSSDTRNRQDVFN